MPATTLEPRCPICPGLTAVARYHDCERIIIHGDRTADGFVWRVDVVTPLADGHRQGRDLEWAINGAIGEAMGHGDED